MIDRRHLLTSALAATAAVASIQPRSLLASAQKPALPENLIHPDLRALVPQIEKYLAMQPPLSLATLAEARKPNALFNRPPLDTVPHEMRRIAGGRGQPEVTIYIVNARPGARRPAILHTHGGGYILGAAKDSVRGLQDLCQQIDCAIVSVDYRLAPETRFSGSVDDNYAGLKWLHDHAAEVGADPAKIALMGESAGGGHAALLAIAARDRGEVKPCFQCLIYPMLDDRTGTSRAVPSHVGTLVWTPDKNRFGWESFLGTKAGGATAPKGGVPARVADLRGLPPAFIGVGSLDLFLDEDIDYAQRLNAAGVPTELNVVPGAFHGFDGIAATLPVGKAFTAAKLNALRRGFGLPPA